ncbi:hypothetical protein N7G274_000839 [Stereocaulon virgatum]|uniref:Uncharacterized protein n=1 Tax=Stereocaulon virgatum TaxID=373712 RepID=A0ABR4APS6_9LECA
MVPLTPPVRIALTLWMQGFLLLSLMQPALPACGRNLPGLCQFTAGCGTKGSKSKWFVPQIQGVTTKDLPWDQRHIPVLGEADQNAVYVLSISSGILPSA